MTQQARWQIYGPDERQQEDGRWVVMPPSSPGRANIDNALTQMSQPSNDRLSAFGSGAIDSATFGFYDELQGALFGEEARRRELIRQSELRQAHPWSYGAGQVGGALAGGGAIGALGRGAVRLAAPRAAGYLANAAQNIGPMGRIAAAAASGGAGGAAYGAGTAAPEDRLRGAADMVLPGMAGGAIFGAGGELLGRVGGAISRSLSPEARSGRMMAETLQRFGPESQTPAQVETNTLSALRDAPPNAMVGDVVPGFSSLVRGAGVRPSAARDELRDAFDARNNAMAGNAADDLYQTLGSGASREAGDAIGALQQTQRTQAAPLYNAAYQQRLDPQRAQAMTAEIMRRNPAIFGPAQEHARALMLSELGQEVTNPSDPRYWHYLLQGAQRELGARLRAANLGDLRGFHGQEVSAYTRAVSAFNTQVRRLLGPEFRRAQDIYSGAARGQEAVLRGYDAAAPRLDSIKMGDLSAWMRRATPGEIEHMRIGALNRLTDELARADLGTGRADVLRALLRNEGQRRVLERIFGGQRGFHELMRRLDRQRDLFRSSVDSGIGVNSHTAPLLTAYQSQQSLTRGAPGIRDAIFQMLTRDAADKFDEGVSNEILRTAGINANQAAAEIAQVGGFQNWAGGRGLLSRAVKERQRMIGHRPRALANAVTGGLYDPIIGQALLGFTVNGQPAI